MEESDKQKTAFVCPLGFWEFNRMPQGISNAPSTFQRLMERCMGDLNRKEVLVFIDDLIVFSRSLEEHEARLIQVLKRLREFGLKLSPEKCKFYQTSVRYLGHIVSQHGVETDPAKVEALKTWPRPNDLKELRTFLGFSGYYRRFVQDYLKIMKPLNDLTAVRCSAVLMTLHCRKVTRKRQRRKNSTSIRRNSLENDGLKIVNGHLKLSLQNLPLLQYWDLPTPNFHMCYTQMPAPPALVQHYTKSKMDRWESSPSQVEELPGVNQSTPPTSWNFWRWNGMWRPSSMITCMGPISRW